MAHISNPKKKRKTVGNLGSLTMFWAKLLAHLLTPAATHTEEDGDVFWIIAK